MSVCKIPPPAKLVCSLLAGETVWLEAARKAMADLWGQVDWQSPILSFQETSYYEREFGPDLKRCFVSFGPLVSQDRLVTVKLESQRVEHEWSVEGRRRVNIDPGLLTAERLVLATGKNFAHRVYLGEGVFADVTLLYRKGSYTLLPWTYPDYASETVIGFWNKVRGRYLQTLKEGYMFNKPRLIDVPHTFPDARRKRRQGGLSCASLNGTNQPSS
jgi:hypothetical protein